MHNLTKSYICIPNVINIKGKMFSFYMPSHIVYGAYIGRDVLLVGWPVGRLVGWLATMVICGKKVHPRPIVTMKRCQETLCWLSNDTTFDPLA
jgi:hypothetical protein